MVTGRKSAFTIYDEVIYERFKRYLFETKQDGSHYVWDLIKNEVERLEKEKKSPQSTLFSFNPQTPAPRIFEDFEHIIRPWLNHHANKDEITLTRTNFYQSYVYTTFLYHADKIGLIPDESRKKMVVTYDMAYEGMKDLEIRKGIIFRKFDP